jgi:hypothetical protein
MPSDSFNPPELNAARDCVLDCLDLHSAAVSERLHYSINPVPYEIDGFDPQNLRSLFDATQDGSQPWIEFHPRRQP